MALALAALLLVALLVAAEVIRGTGQVGLLRQEPPLQGADLPTLSVVIAARNEAEHVETALSSVLALDYPALEVIVVDDRSEDATGAILDRMAAVEPRLRVRHVTLLPEGWLGKNHALHVGASGATGPWLLFTDADVVFEPDALRRALHRAIRDGLDMLACTPSITSPSIAVRIFVASFAFFFGLYARPWRARDPRSRHSIGIGAFNLLRTSAYRAAGGHAPIRLRPDDDLMLGRLMKRHGAATDMLFGAGVLRVAWYPSLGALVQGLMKNSFAGVGYRVWATIASVVGLLAVGVGPFVLAVTARGPLQWLAIAASAALLAASLVATRSAGLPPACGLGLPGSAIVFSWILVRATVLTLWQGGIRWRGTFYPLSELRKNRV